MADKKISALTAATTPLAGTEVLPIVQSGATVKVAVSDLTTGRAINALSVTSPNTEGAVSFTGSGAFVGRGTAFAAGQAELYTAGTRPLGIGTTGASNLNFYTGSIHAFYVDTNQNFVPVTAAKGINFTANTPAAGMTSQLLNWYEEGTFTPTATAGSGTITSYTATGHYTRVGKTVTIFVSIEITNPGSASGNLNFAALPFTSKNVGGYIASINAREDNVTGAVFDVLIQGNATTGLVLNANWTTNAKYLFSATYLLA